MKRTKNIKKVLATFIASISLLTVNNKIYAAEKAYDVKEKDFGYTDLIKTHENDIDQNLITICSYGCSNDNIGSDGRKCGKENEKFSRITYNIDDNTQNKWNIEMNVFLNKNTVDFVTETATVESKVYNYTWNNFGNIIPTSGIYYENPINNGKVNESWDKTTAYTNLQTTFTCPQYFYYDHTIYEYIVDNKKNNMELCYEDNVGSCLSRNEADKTIFGKSNKLDYSFVQELGAALIEMNNDIKASDSADFLHNYYVTEDDICKVIRSYSPKQLVDDLEKENYVNYINESFKKNIQNSPNEKFYTYETITKLSNHLDNNLNEQINSLNINYSNKLGESAEYYVKKCMPELSEEYADSYKDEVSNEMNTQIIKMVEEYTKKLDFDNLTCDELLGDIADMIGTAYFILEIAAIVIAVALTVLDYAKVILSDGQDAMKKTNQKLMKRLIIVVVILLLPALINLILTVFNIENFNSENPLCKINK